MSVVLAIAVIRSVDSGLASGSGSGTRTRDTAIMSRLLYRLSYPAVGRYRRHAGRTTHVYLCGIPSVRGSTEVSDRAPMRNRTADLLLTMETLCRLSYRGLLDPARRVMPTHQDTHCARPAANLRTFAGRVLRD